MCRPRREASAQQCRRLQRAVVTEGMESVHRRPLVMWQGQVFVREGKEGGRS